MGKVITIHGAKNYDKTNYNNRKKAESDLRYKEAVEKINEIIGVNFDEISKLSKIKQNYRCIPDFLSSYPTDEFEAIYTDYKIEGFEINYYRPHNTLFIKLSND